jgi:hypothetical protein
MCQLLQVHPGSLTINAFFFGSRLRGCMPHRVTVRAYMQTIDDQETSIIGGESGTSYRRALTLELLRDTTVPNRS